MHEPMLEDCSHNAHAAKRAPGFELCGHERAKTGNLFFLRPRKSHEHAHGHIATHPFSLVAHVAAGTRSCCEHKTACVYVLYNDER